MSNAKRCFVAACVLWCLYALVPAVRGDELWQTDFHAAKDKAKADNKLLLVDFTGSDWCPWCKKLHEEVFEKDAFKDEYAQAFRPGRTRLSPSEEAPGPAQGPERQARRAIQDTRLSHRPVD